MMLSVIESSVVGMASTARLIQMPLRRSMLRPNSATTMPAIAMPNVLALTAKPIVARLTANLSTSDGRIACAAKRSTKRQEGDQCDDAETHAVGGDHAQRSSARTVRGWSLRFSGNGSTFPAVRPGTSVRD